jgi:hypothetical protein
VRAFNGRREEPSSTEVSFRPNSASSSDAAAVSVIAPTVTPNGGKFKRTAKVTLKTPTRGAWTYYTTNGKTPTTRSTRYTRPLTINRTRTIKAIAVAPGHKKSAVARTKFTKTGGPNRRRTVSRTVHLGAGKHVLRLDFLRGGMNLDWIDIY